MPQVLPAHALYTAAQVRALDAHAIEVLGVPGIELMQRAATAALAVLRQRWPQARRIVVLCGPGNNGGDGFLLGALARAQGLQVEALALSAESHGDAAQARQRFVDAGGSVRIADASTVLPAADVCVDGLFGTGLGRALSGTAARMVDALNEAQVPVVALDIPSGLSGDTGIRLGPTVHAAATVSFVAWKRGLFTGEAADCCGALSLDTLQLPASLYDTQAPDAELLQSSTLPPRPRVSHKGDYGHVLVIGGDVGFGGAVQMAGTAALRCGAGLVSVATRAAHVGALNTARAELMAHGVEDLESLQPLLARADVVALGPGLGQGDWGRALWRAALQAGKPLLLDADGLNLLAAQPRRLGMPAVLTPHPGEAARLLGSDIATVQADRFAAARTLAARHAAVVALKGSGTVIADADGRAAVCPWGNPGMASGGMGDVLSGVVAALMGQGLAPWPAACLGVGLHARAGDRAARDGERGLLASDLFVYLRALVNGRDG
jgi:NAD(P)H-hydrate epimerase